MRLKLISCEILYREMCALVARSPHQVDLEFLPKGLHDIGGSGMCSRLQSSVDAIDPQRYDAMLLGYALCGMGVADLTARSLPLVLPRAHDCITLFLGSRERYLDSFGNHPGVFFKTSGWIERGQDLDQLNQSAALRDRKGTPYTYQGLVAQYGEENAKFLWEQLGETRRNYGQLTYIEMGIEPDDRFESATRQEAVRRGWKFEKLTGDLSLLERLVNGDWDPRDFLVVPPGGRIAASHDDKIVKAE